MLLLNIVFIYVQKQDQCVIRKKCHKHLKQYIKQNLISHKKI